MAQSTDTTLQKLIINQMPRSVYNAKKAAGELDPEQVYLPDTAYDDSLGLTAATPGQIIKVKTVQDGKPTEWEAVSPDYTLTVTVNTQDGVTVTGQTVTVRAGDADGPVYGTAEYNGQPVSFRVADGFAYYAEVTDNLAAHFKPTTVKGVINGANAAVTLLYNGLSTIQTASDIQAALDADMDLTELVGQQITCQRGNDTLSWDVVDYDSVAKVVTLCTHDVLPDMMQYEPQQALMYCENGLAAGNYMYEETAGWPYYFTLTQAIPAGGQLRATKSKFQTYESTTATTQIESGTVSKETIDGATNLGQTGTGNLNHHDRVSFGSNNFGESGILQWLNSDSPANTPMPRLTKFSRPYVPTKAGFKAGLDADFLACIQDTVWKCSANNVYECPASLGGIAQKGKPYTVTAKFALASEIEVFGEYGGVQDGGTVWGLYMDAEATDRIKYYNNTAQRWRLRSPHSSLAGSVRLVDTPGVVRYGFAASSFGVAVACKIAKSKVADIYEKPDTGIPKSDLAQSVQTSLDKADTAISYDSQTLMEAQQKQARTNIGAGQPLFVVNVTTTLSEQGDEVYTADKTAAEIETAYQEGCEIVCRMSVPIIGMGLVPVQLPLASRRGRQIFMFAINQTMWTDKSSRIVSYLVTIADDGVNVGQNNTEIYIKPASGIPKTDLADDVQTSLVREVPSVTASDNGKFLRVVSGAWTAVEIANANGGSF